MQVALSPRYTDASAEELHQRILDAKSKLADRVVILGHHYQRDEIIAHADFVGDSYKLAKEGGSQSNAEFIVFCGVHFMAESADILTPPERKVILPNMAAGCSMADMANIFQVRRCWNDLNTVLGGVGGPGESASTTVVPITYINSAANLKGFVGEKNGSVCTSTNAPAIVQWALENGEKVLFFPDQHLGRNTGVKLGYDPSEMVVWDPFKPLGGNTPESIQKAKFILWKGHCSVHKRFSVEQINAFRAQHFGIKILVHPECELDVVRASDFNGSTEFIVKTLRDAPLGSSWAVGTEINLVNRLAKQMPDKQIYCLDPEICPCSTMYRIHPSFLAWTLEELVEGRVVNQVVVPEPVRSFSLKSLSRMLELTENAR